MDNVDMSRRRFMQAGSMLAASVALAGSSSAASAADEEPKKLGLALVGIGKLSINQILPAFANAHWPSHGLVSGHRIKGRNQPTNSGSIAEKSIYSYDNFESIKDNPEVDVVYVVLPNSMHAEYTIRAAKAGKHVLCEKPMANSVEECQAMIDACKLTKRKLMIGYRLQYEPLSDREGD